MHAVARTLSALTLLGSMLLAGCGGAGDDAGAQADRLAGRGIAVGEPAPGAAPVVAEFIAQAQQAGCADLRNRLYLIDQRYVFADVAGSCADASYTHALYGASPKAPLCMQADSIAGPVGKCTDDAAKALFDVIVKNRLASDLGLGASHKVEPILFASKDPGSLQVRVPFALLDRVPQFALSEPAGNFVIKTQQDWLKLWSNGVVGGGAPPLIDFTKSMVLGVYLGIMPNGCYSTAITEVVREQGVLQVTYSNGVPGENAICTMSIVFPTSLVMVGRSDEPVVFVAKRPAPLK